MDCYICEERSANSPALMRGGKKAVGVCQNCGIGLCRDHGTRADSPGAPFLCKACASAASQKLKPQ